VGISALDACLRWVEAGADWIHLVDLDAAFGRGSNAALLAQVIADLARLHPGVSVQWSGGVSSADDVERALSAGAKRVNLGAGALKDLAATTALVGRFGRYLNVCLDVSAASAAPTSAAPANPATPGAPQPGAAKLAGAQPGAAQRGAQPQPSADLAAYVVHPRGQGGPVGPLEPILAALNEAGTGAYVVTDRVRDGALSGPNLPLLGALSGATSAQVIASGGVSCAGDIAALQDLAASHPNLCGVILGKALYTGQIDLKALLRP
jgi:1-(5-phosphoribosyl)-5-[(5-phosphoribosylamino)methylideneamino] imidazole-4-carboxamide isomerase